MSNEIAEVRQRRFLIEQGIAECQQVIDRFVEWRDSVGAEFHRLAEGALAAVEKRDSLLLQIERESLWRGDYESASDYYDQRGFSRQRMHQIRTEVVWKQLVGELDGYLPLPTGHLSRHLGTTDPVIALPAYRKAVDEAGGKTPSERAVKEWVAAAKEGVDVQNSDAVAAWKDRRHLDEIKKHYKALATEEARDEVRRMIQ